MIPTFNSLSASFELVGLPIGVERATWVPHALAREDVKIKRVEEEWPDRAVQAARITLLFPTVPIHTSPDAARQGTAVGISCSCPILQRLMANLWGTVKRGGATA